MIAYQQVYPKESEYDDDFFNGIQNYCQGDENPMSAPHKCEEREDAHSQFPFKTIGRVVSVFYDFPVKNMIDFPFGTGTLIHPRVVITCGHNIYSQALKALADHVYFQPETHATKPGPLIRVEYIAVHRELMNEYFPGCQNYDIAFLVLQENSITQTRGTLNLNLDFNFSVKDKPAIFLSGYPKQQNLNSKKVAQYWGEMSFKSFKDSFVNYTKSFTGPGHSGSPLILNEEDKNGNVYSIVGIHKGSRGLSYGILLGQSKFQLLEILKKFSIGCNEHNDNDNIKDLNNFIKAQIAKQSSQKKVILGQRGIQFRKLQSNQSLQTYLEKDDDPDSYFNSLHQIMHELEYFSYEKEDEMLLGFRALEFFIKKFIHLKLNPAQQTQLFKKLLEIIEADVGMTQMSDEVQSCQEIGEWLLHFDTAVHFKRKSWMLMNKEREFKSLNQECMQLRDKIVKLLQKRQVASTIDLEKRKRQKHQRLAKFYFGSKNLEHAERMMNQEQEKTHNVDILKGQVLLEKGSLNEALKCFLRMEQKLKEEGKCQKIDYANVLYFIGCVYKTKGDYEKALLHFQRCLKIKESSKDKDDIECATTLNNIGLAYDSKGNYEQALVHFKRCLSIQQKFKGKDAIDCASTLNNIGLVYSHKGDYEQALIHYQRSLKIKEKVKGKDDIDCPTTLSNIASVFYIKGDYEQALFHYQRCLTIQERVKGKDAIICALTLYNLSFVYQALKQSELAKSASERSYKISLKILGEQHFRTKERAQRWKQLC